MSDSNWEFHFRNFNQASVEVRAHHAGCGLCPWHDGRPGCWVKTIPHNPTGGSSSVYVPADWVVNFGQWFDVLKDAIEFIAHLGIFVLSEGADEAALVKALSDIFHLAKDVVQDCLDKLSQEEMNQLLAQARASFEQSCQSVGVQPSVIRDYAARMGLGSDWAFVAGAAYKKYFHDASMVTGKHGWSLFSQVKSEELLIANAIFISEGHLFVLIDDAVKGQLWKNKW